MPSIEASAATAALSANGSADGTITVADTTIFYPGATAWLSNSTPANKRVLILKIVDSTHLKAKAILDSGSDATNLNYLGGSDFTAFTTALGARLSMPRQVVAIDPSFSKHNLI